MNTLSTTGRAALSVIAALALAACASPDAPKEQMAVANSAVEQATSTSTEAPVELASARDKLTRANQAMARKDYALARQLADQAAADAALAQATARSARSNRALEEVRQSIQQLQTQLNRS
jgi:septal ring factor EnvC (AmiA/AmiB activator)